MEDRMWRKNRNAYPQNACVGVDLNRNFDDNFGGPGTSDDSCSTFYHGTEAFCFIIRPIQIFDGLYLFLLY